jgi:hypothetical protein
MKEKGILHLPAGMRKPFIGPEFRRWNPWTAPPYPYNEEPEVKETSIQQYGIRVERNLYVTMSDGARIAVDVYLPDAEGQFPALLSMSPYTKELQNSRDKSASHEAGDSDYFVSRGYVNVIADCRGSGHSDGSYTFFSDREAQDGAELVEWIAGQEWCDGNVGMLGMSYFGIIQLLVAAKKPPHLKAIFPYDALEDTYRDTLYQGGKFGIGFVGYWSFTFVLNHLYYLWKYTASFAEDRPNMSIVDRPPDKNRIPFDLEVIKFLLDIFRQRYKYDGPFHWERSPYRRLEDIEVPVYLGSGWYSVGLHLRGAFSGWEGIKTPKKMLIGERAFAARPFKSHRLEIMRWYDYWLKGMDTGVMEGAPINIYVMGDGRWRPENEWPLARTEWKKLYLHPGGGKHDALLATEAPAGEEGGLEYFFAPLSLAGLLGLPKIVYRTPRLKERVEVTGPIALTLYASSTARDTTWAVRLIDEDERGRCSLLTCGWLKASHREIDEDKSTPYRPWHPHTREEKLDPGRVYEFRIEIWPTSNAFKPGHRIRLEVASQQSPVLDIIYSFLPDPYVGKNTIYHSDEYPSHLIIPVIDSELVFE